MVAYAGAKARGRFAATEASAQRAGASMNNDSPKSEPEPTEETSTAANRFSNTSEFLLKAPLYAAVDVQNSDGDNWTLGLEFFEDTLSCYCTECGRDSVFATEKIQSGDLLKHENRLPHGVKLDLRYHEPLTTLRNVQRAHGAKRYAARDRCFTVELYCSRDENHRIYFTFAVRRGKIQKIGQYPPLSDFEGHQFRKRLRSLPKDLSKLYARAVYLHAHGVGAGSFVYLRRIFETLLKNAAERARTDATWNEAEFQRLPTTEKIKSLRGYVPEVMAENANVYSFLSIGVHELSDEQCQENYPVLKAAIELILEEVEAAKQLRARKKQLSNALAYLNRKHGDATASEAPAFSTQPDPPLTDNGE